MAPSDRNRRVRRPGLRPFASAWIVALAVASTGACGSLVGVSDLHFVDGGSGDASRPSRGDETTGGAGPDGSIEPDADLDGAGATDATSLDAAGDACSATPVCDPDGGTCRAGCSQTLTCNACGQWPGTCAPCSLTFNDTGTAQTFEVPKGVTEVTIEAFGAQGCMGGLGGSTTATIMVTPNETLTIDVGAGGCDGTGANYNGGGLSNAVYPGPGGGGSSDVRQGGTDLSNRIVVAGGGGGAGVVGGEAQSAGGAGGGTTGAPGAVPAGWGPRGRRDADGRRRGRKLRELHRSGRSAHVGHAGRRRHRELLRAEFRSRWRRGGRRILRRRRRLLLPRDGRWRRRRLVVHGPRGDQRDDDAGRERGERQGRHHVLTPRRRLRETLLERRHGGTSVVPTVADGCRIAGCSVRTATQMHLGHRAKAVDAHLANLTAATRAARLSRRHVSDACVASREGQAERDRKVKASALHERRA